jgi:pilus assembly protein CpaB
MRNTRAWVMLAVAVLLAAGAVIAAARWINSQGPGNTSRVAVANVDIGLGTKINADMVKLVAWPSNALPPGAINDATLLATRVARTSIGSGEPIVEGKLAPPGTLGGLSAVVAEGKRAMTVRVNDVVGVAGFALPGNFVDILVNTVEETASSNPNRTQSISKIVLEHILVLAIAQESSRDDTKPKVVNAVTLELSPEQTEQLDLARSVGTLSLVLRNQIDRDPVTTEGATKSSLFDAKEEMNPAPKPAVAAPVIAAVRPVRKPQPAPAPQPDRRMDVIKGMERTSQPF